MKEEQVLIHGYILFIFCNHYYFTLRYSLLIIYLAHEVWTTLSGDGRIGTFYVRTGERKLAEMNIFHEDDDAHLSYIPVLLNSKTKKNISPGESYSCLFAIYDL